MVDVDAVFARALALPAGPSVPWFLDVDGTLLAEGGAETLDDWPSYTSRKVATSTELSVPITWAPDLVDCLKLLIDLGHVHVRWLTSWGSDAALILNDELTLRAGHDVMPMPPEGPVWWKLQAIQEASPPWCIWTDDYPFESESKVDADGFPGVMVSPDSKRGLIPVDLLVILDAIQQHRRD